MHRKTNFLHDSARAAPSPIASQAQGGQPTHNIDPSMLQQINDGVKSLKFEMANMLNKVCL